MSGHDIKQAVVSRATGPAGGALDRQDQGTFAHGQFAVDYEARIDYGRLRDERRERALGALRASDLDALLLYKDENVRYVSGLRAQIIQGKSALLNGCLLGADGSLVLFCSGGEIDRVRNAMPWVDEVHPIPIMEAAGLIRGAIDETIAPVLRRIGLAEGRLGIDEMAFAQIRSLGESLPGMSLQDGDALMQRVRRIKSRSEIAVMQEACAVAEVVTDAAIASVKPGVREYEVVAEAMRALYRAGGEMPHVATPFVASGEHMSPPNRFASDKLIRDGDLVFIDIGAMFNGYYADLGRTVICGAPSRTQQEIFTAVHHALTAGTKAMIAGNTNEDVARAVIAEGEQRGFARDFLSLFIGHGIGMGSNEPPYVGETLTGAEIVTLELGMTMAIEPLIWRPNVRGGGGVRLEDTVMVGEESGVALTRTSFDDKLLLD